MENEVEKVRVEGSSAALRPILRHCDSEQPSLPPLPPGSLSSISLKAFKGAELAPRAPRKDG